MAEDEKKLNELSEEDVGEISGGYYFNASHGCGHDKPCYEVIGSKGEILESFGTKEEAMKYARENNISDYELSWGQLAKLRNGEKPELNPNRGIEGMRYREPDFPNLIPAKIHHPVYKPYINHLPVDFDKKKS